MISMRYLWFSLVLLAAATAAAPAHAAGAWTTFLRASNFTDLLAEGDTVWCATGEAGLLRYDRGTQAFTNYFREPGGLASNALSVIARDRTRRLWVGTVGAGVSRLASNGASWDLLNRFDGLPSDSITVLTASGDSMWIGTTGGIALWNGQLISGALPDGVNPSPFTNNWISGIVEHGDSLYVATRAGAWVSRISAGLQVWTSINAPFPPNVIFLGMVTDGTQLIAHAGAGSYRRPFEGPFWSVANAGNPETYRLEASGLDVFAASSAGILAWNGIGWDTRNDQLPSNTLDGTQRQVFSIAADEQGLLAAANLSGLYAEESGGGLPWPKVVPDSPPGNDIINLAVDRGRVFVATEVDGIGRYDGDSWRLWPLVGCVGCDTTFLAPQYSYPLEVDRRGHKWFGMWGVGFEEFDDTVSPPAVTHHQYTNDLRTRGWASALDSTRGGLWFGMDTDCLGCPGRTPLGLIYYNRLGLDSLNLRQDSLPEMRGTKVHGLTVDRGGRVWVGFTGEGIQHFDWPAVGQPFQFQLVEDTENFDVQALEARGDTVWAMTTRDVRIYNRFSSSFVDSFLLPSVPARLPLRPLAIGVDGTVYVGTTAGLRARRLDGSIADYDAGNSPIAGNAVQAVRVEPGTGVLWIGTTSGLSRFDPGYRPPPAPPLPSLDFKLYPNPVRTTALGISLRIEGTASTYRGVVLDLSGREVHRFGGTGNGGVIWDGRHQGGSRVRPGIYFIRVEAGGKSAIRRIAVVH